MIEALLAGGADPNAQDRQRDTPLHRAAHDNNNPGVVQALLVAYADPDSRSSPEGSELPGTSSRIRKQPSVPLAENAPFIQTLQRLDTTKEKLEHLRSWKPDMAEDNGISRISAIRFRTLLHLSILIHVDAEGSVDCRTLEEDLSLRMPSRCDIDEDGHEMFNITAGDLCPALRCQQ